MRRAELKNKKQKKNINNEDLLRDMVSHAIQSKASDHNVLMIFFFYL